jgi:hypothetical protein
VVPSGFGGLWLWWWWWIFLYKRPWVAKNGKVAFSLIYIYIYFFLLEEFTMSEDNNEPGIF